MIQENSEKSNKFHVQKIQKDFHVIIVTGTPGTGKTTIAKKIAQKKGFRYIDVNKIIKEQGLSFGVDKKRDSKVIDTNKLNKVLAELIEGNDDLVIDSHLSHYLPCELADLCIVTKCELKTLEKRLIKRGYSKEKVRENLDAEIFDTCRVEAQEKGHKIKTVMTDKEFDVKDLF